jgi:hypothetical protein
MPMRVIGQDEARRVVELDDEREPVFEAALALIVDAIPAHDLHPVAMLRAQVRDARLGTAGRTGYHWVATLDARGEVEAVATGRFLREANLGFVMYLAVRPELRGRGLGTRARAALLGCFRDEATRAGTAPLAGVVGEVTHDKPWLLSLVRAGVVVPLDFAYYHPGMAPSWSDERYVLYWQPLGDARRAFSADEVRELLVAVWKQGYGFRDPRPHEGFRAMLSALAGRDVIGASPEVLKLSRERKGGSS